MRTTRWLVLGLAAALSAGAALLAGTAGAQVRRAPETVLSGVAFGYLPRGLGTSTGFDYRYQGVRFASRVWEAAAPAGGWRVDLDADVMRGARLSDGRALHDWFVRYEDRPPAEVHYIRVAVHGHPGWLARDQVFWLQRPGLGVSVELDRARWSVLELTRTGWAAHEVPS